MIQFLKSLVRIGTGDSSKSFALLASVLVGAFLGLCTGVVMIWDVAEDGEVTTDLGELGTFMLCVGGYMAGGGINKAVFDSAQAAIERKKKSDETSVDA